MSEIEWKTIERGILAEIGDAKIGALRTMDGQSWSGVIEFDVPELPFSEESMDEVAKKYIDLYRDWLAKQIKAVDFVEVGLYDILNEEQVRIEQEIDDGGDSRYLEAQIELLDKLRDDLLDDLGVM